MKAYLKKTLKEKVKRRRFAKQEFRQKILKKIIHDKKIPKVKKYYIVSPFFKQRRKSISSQKLVCYLTGRRRGIWSYVSLSRHTINKLNLEAKLPGLSIKS